MKRFIAATAVAITVAGVGCSTTTQDLEGVEAEAPANVVVYQAPDQFPNIAITCIEDGIGVITTTRDTQDPVVGTFTDLCGGGGR